MDDRSGEVEKTSVSVTLTRPYLDALNRLVEELVEGGVIAGETVAMDATFIKASSKRDLHDNRRGASDPDARVGRDGRTYNLGYRF